MNATLRDFLLMLILGTASIAVLTFGAGAIVGLAVVLSGWRLW